MAREAHVLVVDDDPLVRNMLSSRLEMAGYRVGTADDAWQGVVQASGLKVGLVIMDIMMPGPGNGVDGYKKLRRMSPSLPVIFLTALKPEEARALVPADDPKARLLAKPVNFGQLRAAIKDLTGLDREL